MHFTLFILLISASFASSRFTPADCLKNTSKEYHDLYEQCSSSLSTSKCDQKSDLNQTFNCLAELIRENKSLEFRCFKAVSEINRYCETFIKDMAWHIRNQNMGPAQEHVRSLLSSKTEQTNNDDDSRIYDQSKGASIFNEFALFVNQSATLKLRSKEVALNRLVETYREKFSLNSMVSEVALAELDAFKANVEKFQLKEIASVIHNYKFEKDRYAKRIEVLIYPFHRVALIRSLDHYDHVLDTYGKFNLLINDLIANIEKKKNSLKNSQTSTSRGEIYLENIKKLRNELELDKDNAATAKKLNYLIKICSSFFGSDEPCKTAGELK